MFGKFSAVFIVLCLLSCNAFQCCQVLGNSPSKRFQRKISTIKPLDFALLKNNEVDANNNTRARIFFDIAVDGEEIGRLVFKLGDPTLLPLHFDNLIKLCTEERRSIDPLCSFVRCSFRHSPQFVEGLPQYRWAHVLDGRGRNAVGRPKERIIDPERMQLCTHSVYGGVYYGMKYEEIPGDDGVLLTVPLVGPGRGSTNFSIVRVGESPAEWKERLLMNSAVLGRLESGIDTLRTMARQTRAPPCVVGTGKL